MPFELKDRSVVSDRLKAKRVVLITGAGASRGLGADKPMPLMPDWAGILSHDIDESNPGISEVLGIREGISGEEFEENLGKFLQWQQSFPLNDRFKRFGGVSIAGAPSPPVEEWLRNNKTRAAEVGEALQRSLYSNFGLQAVDRSKAIEAYRRLDRVLGGEDTQKICATTNYDPCVEVGFGGFGYRIVDGFDRSQPFQTPVFEPSDLGNWRKYSPDTLPILHLHGAVGWYRQRNGSVIYQPSDQEYNPSLGIPVVLPPDPLKDPLNDATVATLWNQLRLALGGATHVLVLGHSLHDPALVRALGAVPSKVLVLIATKDPNSIALDLLPSVTRVALEFGADMAEPSWARAWLEGAWQEESPGPVETRPTQGAGVEER